MILSQRELDEIWITAEAELAEVLAEIEQEMMGARAEYPQGGAQWDETAAASEVPATLP
jgi:hypothetical protein